MGGSAPLKTPLFCDMIFQNMLIGLRHSYDKLVFEKMLSLRDQSADWSWQSPR